MRTPGVLAALDGAESVLIAGAGGGFDGYAGLPLAFSLVLDGKRVHLANLSFAELHLLDPRPVRMGTLATWLRVRGFSSTVYAFAR